MKNFKYLLEKIIRRIHPNLNDDPKREAIIVNEREYYSFEKTDLNNINYTYSNFNGLKQPSDHVTLIDREDNSFNPKNKYEEDILNKAGSHTETESSCINYMQRIIDNMGFNSYFILNSIGTGFSFIAEGTLAAVKSNCNIYYCLPIVLFKISEENKRKDLFYKQKKSLSNADPSKNLVKGTSLDKNFTLIFFLSEIVTLFGVVLSVFLTKKLERKLTIGLNYIPCFIAGFWGCFYKSMIFPSTAIINFSVVISLVTSKFFLLEAYNSKLRDAGRS